MCPRNITLTKPSGVITSPFYPRFYPGNQNCSWQITAPKGKHVKLEISHLLNIQTCDDPQQPECPCDYLQVQNGVSKDPNGNKKICGDIHQNKTYYSILESLKVLFVSDDNDTKQEGFTANYTLLNYTPPCKYWKIPKATYGPLLYVRIKQTKRAGTVYLEQFYRKGTRNMNNSNRLTRIRYYYMAKQSWGKSCDWFFLGRDSAIRTASMHGNGHKPCVFW